MQDKNTKNPFYDLLKEILETQSTIIAKIEELKKEKPVDRMAAWRKM